MKTRKHFIKTFIFLTILFFSHVTAASFKKHPTKTLPKIPVVFHSKYDISFFGIEKLHPFESKKYGLVYKHLINALHKKHFCTEKPGWFSSSQNKIKKMFYTPNMVTDKNLRKVHTKRYLESLRDNGVIAQITEVGPICLVPNIFNFLICKYLLNPMKYATGGTILATDLALENGWSINLSGGYHHAKANHGEGFCVYADIPLAIKKLHEKNPNLKVLILDLDAHQGNGHESICGKNPLVFIYDIYNGDIYPRDYQAAQYIDFPDNPRVSSGITGKQYLKKLKKTLPEAIKTCKPDLIIYNAGTDIYKKDPLGKMKVSAKDIVTRDTFVFELAEKHNIPITMLLSGGYTTESANIIANSIKNIFKLKDVL